MESEVAMPRGGKRKGAGRKSRWKSSETVAVRVPKQYVEQILEFAHRLDDGKTFEQEPKFEQVLKKPDLTPPGQMSLL